MKMNNSGSPNSRTNKKRVAVLALLADGVSVMDACEATGTPRRTFYSWYANDPEFRAASDVSREVCVRLVENALYKKATSGDLGACVFFLCNRAPDRWRNVQKIEAEVSGRSAIPFVINGLVDAVASTTLVGGGANGGDGKAGDRCIPAPIPERGA